MRRNVREVTDVANDFSDNGTNAAAPSAGAQVLTGYAAFYAKNCGALGSRFVVSQWNVRWNRRRTWRDDLDRISRLVNETAAAILEVCVGLVSTTRVLLQPGNSC